MPTAAALSRLSAALTRVEPDRLAAIAKEFTERYPVRLTSLPVSGLAMMQLRESVNGDAFNLGEIPMSSASVELELGDGKSVSGAANAMIDDADLVTWMAVCDAALRHELAGREKIEALVDEGLAKLQKDQDIRQSILHRTKVRFSLLNEETNS